MLVLPLQRLCCRLPPVRHGPITSYYNNYIILRWYFILVLSVLLSYICSFVN